MGIPGKRCTDKANNVLAPVIFSQVQPCVFTEWTNPVKFGYLIEQGADF